VPMLGHKQWLFAGFRTALLLAKQWHTGFSTGC